VEHAEDGGVDADAERESKQRNGREGRPAPHPAPGVADILQERGERRSDEAIADALLDLLDALEFDLRGAARFGLGHAARDQAGGRDIEGRSELFVKAVFELTAAEQVLGQTLETLKHSPSCNPLVEYRRNLSHCVSYSYRMTLGR